jgi:hypothetical protein
MQEAVTMKRFSSPTGRKVIGYLIAFALGALVHDATVGSRMWAYHEAQAQAEVAQYAADVAVAATNAQTQAQVVARAKANDHGSNVVAPKFTAPTRATMQPQGSHATTTQDG